MGSKKKSSHIWQFVGTARNGVLLAKNSDSHKILDNLLNHIWAVDGDRDKFHRFQYKKI